MKNESSPPVDHGQVVRKRGLHISLAWLFPLLAIAATTWLLWSNWRSEGPLVEIHFDTAPGIQAGKTPLIYRGVTAGTVTDLRLDRTLDKVAVMVRLKAFAKDLAREGTVFWIEQPVVGIGDTSGLDALIQGNSLQAVMGDGPPATTFQGASSMPPTPLESPALVFKLRAPTIPFLDRGSPLYYRGVPIGVVEDKAVDENGRPYLQVVVERKFVGTVRSNARFWPVPATSMRIGPNGVKLDMLGLKAILLGGVEFDIFGPPGDLVKNGVEFPLYHDQAAARATGEPVKISFENGQGLVAGQTEVRRLGLPVGLVESVRIDDQTGQVETVVRFQPAFEQLHDEGAVFTLVRPQITLDGVSGLDTLISGVYIECEPGVTGKPATAFRGRSNDASNAPGLEPGSLHVSLHARSLPRLGLGAPVYHRGLTVGRVTSQTLDAAGEPRIEIAIAKEFARLLDTNARFWPVSGTAIEAGPGVLKFDIAGLQSLVLGGLAFQTYGPAGSPAKPGATFKLSPTEAAARAISPPVQITFDNGQGLLAGETQVRYLGQPVGLVESVAARNGKVETVVRFDAGYEALSREGSSFSIVRLDFSLQGVTGLETALSGVYIECVPAGGGRPARSFTGVSMGEADFEAAEEKGLEIVVVADRSNIGLDAPVTYRGIAVGKVLRKVLANDGGKVGLCAVIDPDYAHLVRENSQFWDASGVKVTFGFFKLKVQTGSLESIARGGIAFATPDDGRMGARVKRGHEFVLHAEPRREWLRWAPTVSRQSP